MKKRNIQDESGGTDQTPGVYYIHESNVNTHGLIRFLFVKLDTCDALIWHIQNTVA